MLARTSISAAGVKGPKGFRSVELSMGMREAAAKVTTARNTPAGRKGAGLAEGSAGNQED